MDSGHGPLNIKLARQAAISQEARAIMASYPEVEDVVNQIGRTDDGTDTDGYYNSEFFVPLRPHKDWPAVVEQGLAAVAAGPMRPRTKDELVADMDAELERKLPGVTWNFSQNIRDNVMEALSGIKGDNSLKIVGPDFNKLQDLGRRPRKSWRRCPGWRTWESSTFWGNRTWRSASTRRNASAGACRWPT